MRQLEIENQLRDVVSRIVVQVELATAQGRTDINLALEDAFIPILRSVYNLPHLVNLNRKQKNYPGIDLGDDHDRVAFQVTSTTTLEKVKATLRQFMDRAYYNTFDELFVLMLARKQASYSQASVNELLTEHFAFNCKKHIIDLSDLLGLVSGLRLAAQERVLAEFQHILGEVDAIISFSSEGIAAPTAITSNLQRIRLPEAAYVAELTIDDKAVLARAKAELNYRGKARSRRSVVKMALLLNGVENDAWVCHDNKLFSFLDIEQCGLRSVVDEGSVERLDVADLAEPSELDNVNVLKQLLASETREQLKKRHFRMHPKDGFFFFGPVDIRLFSDSDYPPKRGTMLTISEAEGVLYTRGAVDFYKTYPGMYVPNPLKITVYEQDSSLESLCDEILGLTKMNWNNTQMDGRLPITMECARKIGDIMKYVSPTEKPQVSYTFYM